MVNYLSCKLGLPSPTRFNTVFDIIKSIVFPETNINNHLLDLYILIIRNFNTNNTNDDFIFFKSKIIKDIIF